MKRRLVILAVAGGLIPLSFVAAPYPNELILQHVLTLAGIVALGAVVVRAPPSGLSFGCVIAFILLHMVGARWLYSYVPYDEWSRRLLGVSLSEQFGWQRNHYDRFVHLAFGVLCVPPASELLQRLGGMRPGGAALMAVASVLAIGSIYEIMEWQVAVRLSPTQVEAYNGQQGDVWDPQKDMAVAWLGAAIAGIALARWRPSESAPAPK